MPAVDQIRPFLEGVAVVAEAVQARITAVGCPPGRRPDGER